MAIKKTTERKKGAAVQCSAGLGRVISAFVNRRDFWIIALGRVFYPANLLRVLRVSALKLGLVLYYESRILSLKALNLFLVLWYPCLEFLYGVFLDVRLFLHAVFWWLFWPFAVDASESRPNDPKL